MSDEQPDPDVATVLVYSHDPAVREGIRLALGRRPARDLDPVDYLEVDTAGAVIEELDAGGIDLAILDGEAWPTGGLGVCRQVKAELADCPPVLVIVGRRDDAWLAVWSRADATVAHPLDPIRTAAVVADLLRRARDAGQPVIRP